MPQAIEWSFATPMTRPRLPCISPVTVDLPRPRPPAVRGAHRPPVRRLSIASGPPVRRLRHAGRAGRAASTRAHPSVVLRQSGCCPYGGERIRNRRATATAPSSPCIVVAARAEIGTAKGARQALGTAKRTQGKPEAMQITRAPARTLTAPAFAARRFLSLHGLDRPDGRPLYRYRLPRATLRSCEPSLGTGRNARTQTRRRSGACSPCRRRMVPDASSGEGTDRGTDRLPRSAWKSITARSMR